MSLLIFSPDNLSPPLAALLDPQLRQDVANKVNQTILTNQGARMKARIKGLIRLRAWAEQKCRDTKKDIPAVLNLGLDADDHDGAMGSDQEMNGNGEASLMEGDAMVT
jgi:glucose-induced degradation protein 8